MDSRTIRLSFVRQSNTLAGPRAAQEFPELCAFVQPHANVSCNAIISDDGLHVQPRRRRSMYRVNNVEGAKAKGMEGELQTPQSDSYPETHAIRNEKRAVLTSELNIPLVRTPNLSAASSYAPGCLKLYLRERSSSHDPPFCASGFLDATPHLPGNSGNLEEKAFAPVNIDSRMLKSRFNDEFD